MCVCVEGERPEEGGLQVAEATFRGRWGEQRKGKNQGSLRMQQSRRKGGGGGREAAGGKLPAFLTACPITAPACPNTCFPPSTACSPSPVPAVLFVNSYDASVSHYEVKWNLHLQSHEYS